jgi:hypothetical protein
MNIDTKGWSEADKQALAAAEAELSAAESRLAEREAAEQAQKNSPAAVLAKLKEDKERAERAVAERAQRDLGEVELAKAIARFGSEKAALLMTRRGPIVLRAATQAEVDDIGLRADGLPSELEKVKAWRAFTADMVVYPPRAEFVALMAEFPGTWPSVIAARDALTDAASAEAAKKG